MSAPAATEGIEAFSQCRCTKSIKSLIQKEKGRAILSSYKSFKRAACVETTLLPTGALADPLAANVGKFFAGEETV